MKIAIAGATGFIGSALCKALIAEHNILALTRNTEKAKSLLPPKVELVKWNPQFPGPWQQKLQPCDAIINLSGKNISVGRWTKKQKTEILSSRINSTKALIQAVKNNNAKPEVMILASAIGFYGNSPDQQLTETSPKGRSFLSDVCSKLETLSQEIKALGIRDIILRTSIVLDPSGGALKEMIKPFKFFLGSKFATGSQSMSWITLADQISAIKFLIENKNLSGIFNLASPNPVQNKIFAKKLAAALNRPCLFTMPEIALKILFGQKAKEIFLTSQNVYPQRLLDAGFNFKYPDLGNAFKSMNL